MTDVSYATHVLDHNISVTIPVSQSTVAYVRLGLPADMKLQRWKSVLRNIRRHVSVLPLGLLEAKHGKVAGPHLDEVIEFFNRPNPSSHTMRRVDGTASKRN
jgi:hypothetical protein